MELKYNIEQTPSRADQNAAFYSVGPLILASLLLGNPEKPLTTHHGYIGPPTSNTENLSVEREWESTLRGYESTGSRILEIEDYSNFLVFKKFAESILKNSTDIPDEFNEIFIKNYRDLLA